MPEILYGSKPTDEGHLLFSDAERTEFLAKEPKAEKFILPFISAHEFINGENRWCLWLKNVSPTEWRTLPEVVKRVQSVREFRAKSKKAATVRLAESPYLFGETRQPASDYVLIPLYSSENRKYVPISFFSQNHIVANSCSAVLNATLFHFGVLTSAMHNAWMRQICGRIKSDFRYSNTLVYNNFPFPQNSTDRQREKVENAAQAVLDARAQFPEATLADLYDPDAMPQELLKAHRDLDDAVDACYGSRKFKTDLERLEFLFDLYRQYTDPLTQIADRETKRAKWTRKTSAI